jgi:hypothetical protein
LKHIVDDNIKSITIVLGEGFWPLKFSDDKCFLVKNDHVLENYIISNIYLHVEQNINQFVNSSIQNLQLNWLKYFFFTRKNYMLEFHNINIKTLKTLLEWDYEKTICLINYC